MVVLLTGQGCEKAREFIAKQSAQSRSSSAKASFSGAVVQITDQDYDAFINQKNSLIVVSFTADWCGPCRQLSPVLERVSAEFGDSVKLGKVDVDNARNTAMRTGVRGIPDVRFFRNGNQVHRFTGAQPEAKIREDLTKFTSQAKSDDEEPGTLLQKLLPEKFSNAGDEPETEDEGPAIRPMPKDWLPPGIERK